MNHKTKFVSVFLALMLALSLALPAMAESETGKITINNASANQTYEVYRVFDLAEGDYDFAHNAYRYTLNSAWEGLLEYKYTPNNADGTTGTKEYKASDYVEEDPNAPGYIIWKNTDNADNGVAAKEFAQLVSDFLSKHEGITAVQKETTTDISGEEKYETAVRTVEFTGLPLGYYLVKSSLGTLVSLDTTNTEVTMKEKNEVPTSTKDIEKVENVDLENTNPDGTVDTATAGIGATVTYKVVVTAKPGSKSLIYHDIMDTALDFDADSVTVKVGETTLEKDTHYTLEENPDHEAGAVKTNLAGDCRFDITFKLDYLNSITESTDITITYTAVVNESAAAGSPVENKGQISFGGGTTDDPVSPPDKPKVTPWEFEIFKYTNVEGTDTSTAEPMHPLAGAKFVLRSDLVEKTEGMTDEQYMTAIKTDPLPFRALGETRTEKEEGKAEVAVEVYQYYPENVQEEGTEPVYEFVTKDNGKFFLSGLSAGTYYLYETEAPALYNALKEPVTVTIAEDGSVTYNGTNIANAITYERPTKAPDGTTGTEDATKNVQVPVINNTGVELPSTGGIGTTIFYVVGGCLCVGAVVLLVTKRRMNIGRE